MTHPIKMTDGELMGVWLPAVLNAIRGTAMQTLHDQETVYLDRAVAVANETVRMYREARKEQLA